MKKLDLHDLKVESFATADEARRLGTVVGHMPPPSMWTCPEVGCPVETEGCPVDPQPTVYQDTCQHTCQAGCHLSLGGSPDDFSCDPGCLSYYTNCHRCTF
jgi:hypothetical protein